jgi:hypothetical protein
MIFDIAIHFNNWLQDYGSQFDNLCRVQFVGDTVYQAASEDMPIAWEWSLMKRDSSGAWVRQPIATSFNLTVSDVSSLLCNGVFMLSLRATDTESGRMWEKAYPVFLQHNLVSGTCPSLMPYPASLSAEQYVQQAYLHGWAAPHIRGSHFIGGKVGDLDDNGVVNTADLLIFTTKIGQ